MASLLVERSHKTEPILGYLDEPVFLIQGLSKFDVLYGVSKIYVSSRDGRYEQTSFQVYSRVAAVNTIEVGTTGVSWILVLTELNDFYVISLQKRSSSTSFNLKLEHAVENTTDKLNSFFSLKVVKTINILDISLRKNGLEQIDMDSMKRYVSSIPNRFILVDETSKFIFIHTRHGFIEVLELLSSKDDIFQMILDNKHPPGSVKNPELLNLPKYVIFEELQSFWIGDNPIIDIKCLNECYLQIVTKNIDLSYCSTFYQLEKVRKSVSLQKKNTVGNFESKPDLIISMNYFTLFCFNDNHIIYPIPEVDLAFSESDDGVISLQLNRLINKLTVNSGLNKSFIAYYKLNDNIMILVTYNLEIYVLYLDYEYIPSEYEIALNSSIRKRTRSNDVEFSKSKLKFSRWEIRNTNYENVRLHGNFIEINEKLGDAIRNTIMQLKYNMLVDIPSKIYIPYRYSHVEISDTAFLKINRNTLLTSYSNLYYSTIKSSDSLLKIEIDKSTIQQFFILGSFIIVLVKSRGSNGLDSFNKECIKIYHQPDQQCIATYELEEDVNVTNMKPLNDFKTYLPESNDFLKNEVQDLEKLLCQSFVILTESLNYDDYDNDDDFFKRNRTEILLFVINEKKELELKTMAILNYRLTSFDQLDHRTLILWGYKMQFNMGLEIYKSVDEIGDSKLDLKFIVTYTKPIPEIENNITITRELKKSFWLLVDPFTGIYLTRIESSSNKVVKPKLLFKWRLISAIDVYSEDFIIFGDSFGNLFTVDVNYAKKVPKFEIHSMFNLNNNPITSISCHPLANLVSETNENKFKLCSIGTSDGIMYHLYGFYKIDEDLRKLIKSNNNAIVNSMKENVEFVANPFTIDKTERDAFKLHLLLYKMKIDNFLKVSLLTDFPLNGYGEIKDVNIIMD